MSASTSPRRRGPFSQQASVAALLDQVDAVGQSWLASPAGRSWLAGRRGEDPDVRLVAASPPRPANVQGAWDKAPPLPEADGAVPPEFVLLYLRNCADEWDDDVRLVGSLTAKQIVGALDAALTHFEPSTATGEAR